ncbi:MAG: TIGR02391 family protein [Nitrospirae bacterium GWA2_42_11]|nr:MAG: TIGR02391 family protein [Nitrospirae bacterium GWA2_42_11]
MSQSPFKMRFDPQTIKHLGLRMYSTLAPALAEIISNSYDADATNVTITLIEDKGNPKEIRIKDDGEGISYEGINNKFLVIGRNRRDDEGDKPSAKYMRLPTGKKGLGKLALFGLAKTITITTVQAGKLNELVLDWDDLMAARGSYSPKATIINQDTKSSEGTVISMTGLKRKTSFDFAGLADSLSRIFLFDDTFNLLIESPSGDRISIDNKRKYSLLNKEFDWTLESPLLVPTESEYAGKIRGQLLTSEKPITPSSGLRGITLFSRGKLVNAPEFFSSSTSSHFYQYLTGWISVDFIDLLEDDVISTNRQSIDWEHTEMAKLRNFLSGIVSQINVDWRKRRKEKKDQDLKEKTGIDTSAWIGTLSDDVKANTIQIIEALGGKDALEKFTPVIKALHELVPEYPLLHWRHLHPVIQDKSRQYYINRDYYTAFIEAAKSYSNSVKQKSGSTAAPDYNLMAAVYKEATGDLNVIGNYKKQDGSAFSDDTKKNIQTGQQHLSQGIIAGGRNPLSHEEVNELKKSDLFSEKDCLDLLSLLSHLFKRLDNSIKRIP